MYSNIRIPTVSDYIATSLTDGQPHRLRLILIFYQLLSPLQSGLEVKEIVHQNVKTRI